MGVGTLMIAIVPNTPSLRNPIELRWITGAGGLVHRRGIGGCGVNDSPAIISKHIKGLVFLVDGHQKVVGVPNLVRVSEIMSGCLGQCQR